MKRLNFLIIFVLSYLNSFSQEASKEKSYFLFPEFTQGEVIMKTGERLIAKLNYNTLSEEMIFEDKGKKLAIGNVPQVDSVIILNRKFIVLNNKFVELLHHSTYDLYAEHRSRVIELGKNAGYGMTSKTEAIDSYSSVSIDNKIYELGTPKDIKTQPYSYYWLSKNGELMKAISLRQLKKWYSSKKNILKTYEKQNKITFENQECIIQLIRYMEAN